jgi:4-amino-4-deoxy-L-arabinose transferase-like glycosyltransferase
MEDQTSTGTKYRPPADGSSRAIYPVVLLFAAVVYLGCILSPPSLMDDVDAVHAQIGRNMLASGDWVTARLDGVIFLDKAPLVYWLIAGSYKIFGVHDWAARIPIALSAIASCLLTAAFGAWAFDKRAGLYAGLCMSTCIGLFLFTRVLIPDVMVTFTVTLAMWALLRAVDEQEPHPRLWAFVLAASLGTGLLLKSLIAILFPVAAAVIYLGLTRQLISARTWKRLHPFTGLRVVLLIAAPWHILAAVRNPPFFAWTLHNGPGQYHGFLWYYFVNEQVLRFLNLRYPRDYSTVPRLYFWLLHLVWLFPWSVYFPALAKLSFKPVDRAGQVRLLALCWTGFVLIFFTFSTTQEYYSMPCYPAIALLLASAMAAGGDWVRRGTRALCVISAIAAVAVFAILVHVHGVPTPGDISSALSRNPKAYTLSLGHMEDLTLDSFAYLRLPLVVAGIAFLVGAVGTIRATGQRAFLAAALMMVLFFHAARLAMVVFDPYMGSRPLARVLDQSPGGELIVDHHYYAFSSVFFYTNRSGLMLNGRWANLEYGSWAPGAPQVFIGDGDLRKLWAQPERYYLLTFDSALPHYDDLIGPGELYTVTKSGGKVLLTNHALTQSELQNPSASGPDRPFTARIITDER